MGLTRNQVYSHGYRGFESLLFRTAPKKMQAHTTGPTQGPVFLRPAGSAGRQHGAVLC